MIEPANMTALMYHDVVPDGADGSSGFPGRDAASYKVTPERFESHLKAIVERCQFFRSDAAAPPALTFDDGGASAMRAADILERYGLRGRFFATVNYLESPGFLTRSELRELQKRGHVIGSHSCSHPLRMAHCSYGQLMDEWTRSRAVLIDMLGHDVAEASVPGGDFAPPVAHAAAAAGFKRLFTSEPLSGSYARFGLTLQGRFTIRRWTLPRTAAALADGDWFACARQRLSWNGKKIGKQLGGGHYLELRKILLRHGNEVRWGDQR